MSFQLNLGMYTTDKKTELSVLVDRATGGASIKDGQVEIMLHRLISRVFFSYLKLLFYFRFENANSSLFIM